MFDYVRSSYELGEHFTNTRCHTKDIEDGYSGTMSDFWLSPSGQLHLIDYSHTADFVELKEGDEGYSEMALLNFRWIPNGTHGKVRPWYITKYISIYPEQWEGEWEEWPRCIIHFVNGKIQNFNIINRS